MRLVRFAVALLCLAVWLVPAAVLAHDGVSGTPDVTVRITGAGVSDQSVSVPVGGLVAFVNQDDERHRMRSRTEPGEFDTGDIEPGERHLVSFSTEGAVRYTDERSERGAFGGTIEVRATSAGGGSGSGTGGTGAAGGGGGSTTSPATSASITIGERVFTPATVTISTGGAVTWTNRDDREHTATSTGGGTIASPVLGSGQSYRTTFAAAGTFAFLCAIHPEMRGTVNVVAGGTGTAGPGTALTPTPTPTPGSPAPTATATALPPAAAIPAAPDDPAPDDPTPVAAVTDATEPTGQLLAVGAVLAINVCAFLLFARTVGGAMRRPDARYR